MNKTTMYSLFGIVAVAVIGTVVWMNAGRERTDIEAGQLLYKGEAVAADGTKSMVEVRGNKAMVDGVEYQVSGSEAAGAPGCITTKICGNPYGTIAVITHPFGGTPGFSILCPPCVVGSPCPDTKKVTAPSCLLK